MQYTNVRLLYYIMANSIDHIEDVNIQLLKNIQYELTDVRREVTQKIDSISQQFSAELKSICRQLKLIRRHLKVLEKRVNRQHAKCHIIIRNIPYSQNENLQYIFEQICNRINFHIIHSYIEIDRKEFSIDAADRCAENKKTNFFIYPPFIEVCFLSMWERKYFMKLFLIHGPLYLIDIGFDGVSQVLISENVTEDELKMFYFAIATRQAGLL